MPAYADGVTDPARRERPMPPVHPGSWAAPVAPGPLDATVRLPGSKSATNRSLVLAALAEGTSRLRSPLRSRDTLLMAAGLRALGHDVREAPPEGGARQAWQGSADWEVRGRAGPAATAPGGAEVDVGNAGTVARFLPAVAALGLGTARFDGDPRVRERPLAPLLLALRRLGAELDQVNGLPVLVTGRGYVAGGAVEVDATTSSQLISGLLLAAPRFEDGLRVAHVGGRLPSAPHIEMTVQALRSAGAVIDRLGEVSWSVAPGRLRARDVTIEPDLSTAAAYLAAPLVTGGRVTVLGWPTNSAQPGAVLPVLLTAMGAKVTHAGDTLTVHGGAGLHGIDADLGDAPELTMVLTALAALADTPSRFTGVAHIRLQETDRLAALARELTSLGGDVSELRDGIAIRPRRLTGDLVRSYDDHRVAMAWAVLGLGVPGLRIDDIATTAKTVPDFTGSWSRMLATAAGS